MTFAEPSPTRPEHASPITEQADDVAEAAGDPVCWLDQVCPTCGLLTGTDAQNCPRCGETMRD